MLSWEVSSCVGIHWIFTGPSVATTPRNYTRHMLSAFSLTIWAQYNGPQIEFNPITSIGISMLKHLLVNTCLSRLLNQSWCICSFQIPWYWSIRCAAMQKLPFVLSRWSINCSLVSIIPGSITTIGDCERLGLHGRREKDFLAHVTLL